MKTGRLIGIAAAVSAALALSPGAVAAKQYIFGSYLPPKHNVNTVGLEPLFKELKPKVDWRMMAGGQLFSGKATLKSVGNRIADGGVVIPSYVQSALPYGYLSMDLMYAADDAILLNAAILDTFLTDCPECTADYHRNKTVLLGTYGVDGWGYLCHDSAIKTVDDLKGKRIRTSGALGRFAAFLGGTPVAMTSDDMVEAIARGQIDCIAGSFAWLKSYPIEDSIHSVLDLNKGATTVDLFVMNRDSWKGLTKDQKVAMLKAMAGAVARTTVLGYMGDNAKAKKVAISHHIAIHDAPKSFDARYQKFREQEREKAVKDAKARGAKNAAKVVDSIFSHYEKWEKIMGPMDRSNLQALTDRYAKQLWDHIYSKVDPEKL
jgi:TRAP-type C4-dicarboxylate transport system substrate-binding protein